MLWSTYDERRRRDRFVYVKTSALTSLIQQLQDIPTGYSTGMYQGKKYGISKSVFNQGKSIKLYAEELGGNDFISLNFYQTNKRGLLKPCEMSEAKVRDFLAEVMLIRP